MSDPQKLENIEPDTKSEEQIITYLEEDAGKIRAHVAGQLLPGQAIIYALLLRVTGLNTTAENIHDGWAAWRLLCRPNDPHKDLVPYDDLNPATQILDEPYAAAIREVAANQIESMPYTNSRGIPERLEELPKELVLTKIQVQLYWIQQRLKMILPEDNAEINNLVFSALEQAYILSKVSLNMHQEGKNRQNG